jgi:hypothetical protein
MNHILVISLLLICLLTSGCSYIENISPTPNLSEYTCEISGLIDTHSNEPCVSEFRERYRKCINSNNYVGDSDMTINVVIINETTYCSVDSIITLNAYDVIRGRYLYCDIPFDKFSNPLKHCTGTYLEHASLFSLQEWLQIPWH